MRPAESQMTFSNNELIKIDKKIKVSKVANINTMGHNSNAARDY